MALPSLTAGFSSSAVRHTLPAIRAGKSCGQTERLGRRRGGQERQLRVLRDGRVVLGRGAHLRWDRGELSNEALAELSNKILAEVIRNPKSEELSRDFLRAGLAGACADAGGEGELRGVRYG